MTPAAYSLLRQATMSDYMTTSVLDRIPPVICELIEAGAITVMDRPDKSIRWRITDAGRAALTEETGGGRLGPEG